MIDALLKDAMLWGNFRERLQHHVRVAESFVEACKENEFLANEVAYGAPSKFKPKADPDSSLEASIKALGNRCENRIAKLDGETNAMIQLVRLFHTTKEKKKKEQKAKSTQTNCD